MAKLRTFSDVDFYFGAHPHTGDLTRTYDATAVKAAVKHLVLTNFYGRPFHPEIGSHIAGLLFENRGPLLDYAIEESIKEVIQNWEPRVEPGTLEVTADFSDRENAYRVRVEFTMRGLLQPLNVDILLQRVR
jgi:phage baseplate assembly protein W